MTKVTLVNFRSNADREKAFNVLKDKTLKDTSGCSLSCKRARTAQQKNRNDILFKAEELVKKSCKKNEKVKLDFKKRCVLCDEDIVFDWLTRLFLKTR